MIEPGGYAVQVRGMYKHYKGGGKTAGLNGFELSVGNGTLHALLGPNGAGKTTAVRILSTLLEFDSGTATVAGYDLRKRPDLVRRSIGFVGQNAAVDEVLDGRQNLVMFGRLHHLSSGEARRRAESLLEQFDLTGLGSLPVSRYSGGLRRRLDLAVSLIVSPKVLFLDEPTAGLDPRSRLEVWNAIKALMSGGTSVLLTTQYLEEADRTADRVSVLREGRVVAEGTPDELKERFSGGYLEIVLQREEDLAAAGRLLSEFLSCGFDTEAETRTLRGYPQHRAGILADAIRMLERQNIRADDLSFRRPTLDEVFLHLTGAEIPDAAGEKKIAMKGADHE